MIAPSSATFAATSLTGLTGRGLTSLSMASAGYKPWDVKQEGGQMESGWGNGETQVNLLQTQ